MKSLATVNRIAKAELKSLFYSPIAWLLIVIMSIQAGAAFSAAIANIVQMQSLGVKWDQSVADAIFLGRHGVFGAILQSLYLYLPLLTMGLISREISSGTVRLLYSSPIRVREIVIGKFLSMAALCLLMVGIIAVFVAVGHLFIEHPDTSKLLTALLALYLLFTAQAAIGLFMSSLSSYQIVAAACTFVVMWALDQVGGLWQGIAWIRNITYFLSMSGRTGKLASGLITSKDLIYFFLIIVLFIGLAILRLKGSMESRPFAYRFGRYALLIGIVVSIGTVSSIPSLVLYYDVTKNKSNTIVPAAQKLISEMRDEPLVVTGYANMLGGYWELGSPESYNRNLAEWEPYMRFNHNLQLRQVFYYDSIGNKARLEKMYPGKSLEEIARLTADVKDLNLSDMKKPAEIRKMIDLSEEPGWYIMQLEYKKRKTFLRVFEDQKVWPTETEVVAALKRLTLEKMPKFLFVTGDYERRIDKMGDREYREVANLNTFRYSLLNQGFDVDTINLSSRDIPDGITALILADPKSVPDRLSQERLNRYIDNGGNLFISGEPAKQSILNPLISQFGVKMLDGMIVQTSRDLQPDLSTPKLTDAASGLFPGLQHASHMGAKVSTPNAGALAITDGGPYTIKPLLETDSSISWLKKGSFVTDSAEIGYSPETGDIRRDFPVAVQATREIGGRQQRILISADADFMANSELGRSNVRTANFVYTLGIFSWLNYGEFPIDSSRPLPEDRRIALDKEQTKALKWVFVWIMPGLIALFGTILLIRRKRK